MSRLRPAALALILLLGACATAAPSPVAEAPRVDRVFMLLRHGIRPPTRMPVTPEGVAAEPWAQWDTTLGHLTPNGYRGAVLMAEWTKTRFIRQGLLPSDGCPEPGAVLVRANSDQRTRESGRALLEGIAPGCGIAVEHSSGQRDDPLFQSIDLALVDHDREAARAALLERAGGDIDDTMPALRPAFERLDEILGCCAPAVCAEAGLGEGCGLADLPHHWADTDPNRRIDFEGPLEIGGKAVHTLLLEYLEGMPAPGWGRLAEDDLVLLSSVHAAEFDLLSRTPYIATRGATPILERILEAFEAADGPRLVALIGHDTNASNVGGALDLHWTAPGYAPDDAAVGGAIGFELSSRGADRFVRVFYQAQSPRQLRGLQTLDADNPPGFAYMDQPLCGLPQDRTLCRYEDFEAALRSRIVR